MRTSVRNTADGSSTRLILAFAASVALHAFLVGLKPRLEGRAPSPAIPVEIWQPHPPRPAQRIAESEARGATRRPDRGFLGERDQTVQKQTHASNVGAFSPGRGRGAGSSHASRLGWRELGVTVGRIAATDDYLPGTHAGTQTSLNTQEFRFFSFFRRVKEKVGQIWRPEVEEISRMLSAQGRLAEGPVYVTRLAVELGASGRVESVERLKSSGLPELDALATQAFRRAEKFTNPPRSALGANGRMGLVWEFIVQSGTPASVQLAREE